METLFKLFDGSHKNYVSFLRQAEATVASLPFKTGSGSKKKTHDVLGILLLGVHISDIPSPNTEFATDLIDVLIASTKTAGQEVPARVKSVLRSTFQDLADQDTFYAAQKEVLNAILKLLSPTLPEVLNFEINDVFVASRLICKLHRKFLGYVQKNIASINDDILNHVKKFKQFSQSKTDLATYFATLHQLSRVTTSAKGHFEEMFLVKQVLNEVAKDTDRVALMILGARLQEYSDLSLEGLESQISEKITDPEFSPQINSLPGTPSAYFAPQHLLPKQSSFLASAPVSPKAAKHPLPTLKNKTTPPSIQRIDPSIWHAWPEAKQQKYLRLAREFRTTVLQMLQDADEDADDTTPSAALAFQADPGAFGFGSNAF